MGLAGTTGIVTGASGFIGRAILSALPSGTRVYATFNEASDFPQRAKACRAEVVPIRIDLAQRPLAPEVPEVDWALLLASRVETVASRRDPLGALVSIAGVAANSIMGLRASHYVHLSSGSVYETLEGKLAPERALRPRLPYSIGKLAAELLFQSYVEGPYWNLRFFGAFGPGEPEFKLARRLVDAFSGGAHTFVIRGDGTNRIDPMYVDDAARALVAFLSAVGESRTVDLCQGEGMTVREFARTAYDNVHPDPSPGGLELIAEGEAHERMLGVASPSGQEAITDARRMTIADGFRSYAKALKSG